MTESGSGFQIACGLVVVLAILKTANTLFAVCHIGRAGNSPALGRLLDTVQYELLWGCNWPCLEI